MTKKKSANSKRIISINKKLTKLSYLIFYKLCDGVFHVGNCKYFFINSDADVFRISRIFSINTSSFDGYIPTMTESLDFYVVELT